MNNEVGLNRIGPRQAFSYGGYGRSWGTRLKSSNSSFSLLCTFSFLKIVDIASTLCACESWWPGSLHSFFDDMK